MKTKILQQNLVELVQDLQRVVSSRPSQPILSCFLLHASQENSLVGMATDLQTSVVSLNPSVNEEMGSCAVPAKIFSDFCLSLPAEEITLELIGQELQVSCKTLKANIPCLTENDFPKPPKKDGKTFQISTETFLDSIKQTMFSASTDESRPVLTSLFFTKRENPEVVATDGFRLAVSQILQSEEMEGLQNFLIPSKAIQELVRAIQRKKPKTLDCTVSEEHSRVFFQCGNTTYAIQLMEGEFPPYQKIIPSSFSTQIIIDGEELSQKLKTAMIFSKDSSGIIKMVLSKEELKIFSLSSTLGKQESVLPIKVIEGKEEKHIAFAAKYIQEFLLNMKPKEVWMGINESLKPALFKVVGKEDFLYVVMPFKLSESE